MRSCWPDWRRLPSSACVTCRRAASWLRSSLSVCAQRRRRARDQAQPVDARQARDQFLAQSFGEHAFVGRAADRMQRQHDQRRRSAPAGRLRRACRVEVDIRRRCKGAARRAQRQRHAAGVIAMADGVSTMRALAGVRSREAWHRRRRQHRLRQSCAAGRGRASRRFACARYRCCRGATLCAARARFRAASLTSASKR